MSSFVIENKMCAVMKGCIKIEGLEVYGYHGLYEKERFIRQKFVVSLEVHYQIRDGRTISIEDVVDYEEIVLVVEKIIHQREELIESLALKMLNAIMNQFQLVEFCKVEIIKFPLIQAKYDSIRVELQKFRI